MSDELKHELYVLEQQLLNEYEERSVTPIDLNDQKAMECIRQLQFVAFEENSTNSRDGKESVNIRRMETKKEFKKLGFKDDQNPANDFLEVPPGMLALDNIYYFAKNHPDL